MQSSLSHENRRGQPGRQPAVPFALALAVGILADRWSGLDFHVWLSAAGAAAAGWLILYWRRRMRTAALLLLLSCAATGAARHHQFRSLARADDLSRFAAIEPRLVRLRATALERPVIRPAQAEEWKTAVPPTDRSHCLLEAVAMATTSGDVPVSGRVRLTVRGRLFHVEPGDEIAVVGQLLLPTAPGNPAQFDFRDHLRRQGCRCLLFADHPASVTTIRRGSPFSASRIVARLRERAERLCEAHLSEANVPLAAALLVGDRARMPDDVRTQFADSGTAHVLAISGLHVGILAGLFWIVCRLLAASPRTTALVVVAGVILYAVVSGGRPPVLRATLFVVIAVGGYLLRRGALAMNSLALAAAGVLAWNPTDLFDVGTQLSFLAVTGIILVERWRTSRATDDGSPHVDALTSIVWSTGPGRQLYRLGGWLLRGYAIIAGIWLLTLPLTAARFHLASPVGFLINVLLIPYVCLLLASGFAFLLGGTLVPFTAAPLGSFFDLQLSGLLSFVRSAAGLHLGHIATPGPSAGWLWGYYLLAACLATVLVKGANPRRAVQALLVWVVAGLLVGFAPNERDELRCTFLDVGHGCAVLIELPNGRTLLYDAGTLSDASRAGRIVEHAVWSLGHSHLDAVVVSHADVDHFNGLFDLIGTIPVGSLLLAQPFLDFEQQAVRELCAAAQRERIPLRVVQAGDRLLLDKQVAITVLHPPGNRRYDGDNENSIVLLVEYAGRRILLTGDLEKFGLRQLLSTERRPVDVLLAPHHGSRAANPPELAAWAEPSWVVVSAGDRRMLPRLNETYRVAKIVSTDEYGAVTFSIQPNGSLSASGVRNQIESSD